MLSLIICDDGIANKINGIGVSFWCGRMQEIGRVTVLHHIRPHQKSKKFTDDIIGKNVIAILAGVPLSRDHYTVEATGKGL